MFPTERLPVLRKEKRTYKDRREYLIKAVYARRKKVREMAVAYKGASVKIAAMTIVWMRWNFII